MSVVYLLVPVALGLVGAAIAAFLWATRKGQFDDLETPALRVLGDDDEVSARPDAAPRTPRAPSRSR